MNFTSEKKLNEHKVLCNKCNEGNVKIPDENSFINFKNRLRSMKHPMVMFADTESILINVNENRGSGTNRYQKHQMISYCIAVQYINSKGKKRLILKSYRAKDDEEDVSIRFIEQVEKIAIKLANIKANKKLIMTKDDWKNYNSEKICWICNEEFEDYDKDNNNNNKIKVRDHDHYTGKYRGPPHKDCNLKLKKPKFVPIIFHNGSGYDFHLIIESLAKTEGEISIIPQNEEKYICMSKKIKVGTYKDKKGKEKNKYFKIRFIDSFKFMSSGLDKLTENLLKCNKCDNCCPGDCIKRYIENDKMKIYKGIGNCSKCINCIKKPCINPMLDKLKNTGNIYKDKVKLLIRKGVFPYEYFNSSKRFNEDKLPDKNFFYSSLNDSNISDDDYEYAIKIWKEFDMKTFGDYHDLYLNTDVLLLSDIFNEFREICLTNYKLDPCRYYTTPGLSWDALLKHSKIKLELLSDYDMLLMFEQGTRGGISTITKRYSVANNKYMKCYDENEENKFLIYLDANNLYGWAMSLPLPVGGFEWMDEKELDDWRNISCILMVDVDYPKELHDKHNDYPFLCENVKVGNVNKLIPNLWNKKNYVCYGANLKQAEKNGLIVRKVIKGIKFREEAWMKSYIDLNTELRKGAKNEFEKDFFKLMNNSVFGKTMENMRKRIDYRLVNNKKDATKLINKFNFKHAVRYNNDLVGILMNKININMNKPLYCGMVILELSKTLMYDFHYDYMKEKFDCDLLFTDTDSLCYEVRCSDYLEIGEDINKNFDTSNYPKDHPSGMRLVNKKVLGMMKDEFGGRIMKKFYGVKSKLYSCVMDEGSYINKKDGMIKKCKGIIKNVVKKEINEDDYKKCILDREVILKVNKNIRSVKHKIYTEKCKKIAMRYNDDKRYILEDGISTLALGHFKIVL